MFYVVPFLGDFTLLRVPFRLVTLNCTLSFYSRFGMKFLRYRVTFLLTELVIRSNDRGVIKFYAFTFSGIFDNCEIRRKNVEFFALLRIVFKPIRLS